MGNWQRIAVAMALTIIALVCLAANKDALAPALPNEVAIAIAGG